MNGTFKDYNSKMWKLMLKKARFKYLPLFTLNLFNLHKKMTVKSNLSNQNMNLENITSDANSYVNELVKNNKKKKILRSNKSCLN